MSISDVENTLVRRLRVAGLALWSVPLLYALVAVALAVNHCLLIIDRKDRDLAREMRGWRAEYWRDMGRVWRYSAKQWKMFDMADQWVNEK